MKTVMKTVAATTKGHVVRVMKHVFAYSRYWLSACVVALLFLGVYDRLLIRKQAQTLRAQQVQIQSQKARFTRARHLMNESAEAKDKGEHERSRQLRMNAQLALR
jgi:hypothetical protein